MTEINWLLIKVNAKLEQIATKVFALNFQGRSSEPENYMAVLVLLPCFPVGNVHNYALPFFISLSDEVKICATSHKDTINEVPQFYGKDLLEYACINGKKCLYKSMFYMYYQLEDFILCRSLPAPSYQKHF